MRRGVGGRIERIRWVGREGTLGCWGRRGNEAGRGNTVWLLARASVDGMRM